MVSFKKNIKDTKLYAWETTWFVLKLFIVIGFLLIISIVYLFVTSKIFEPKRELIGYGYTLTAILIIMIVHVVRVYFYYKKNLNLYFRDADPNGDVELTVSVGGDEYVIENLSGKSVFRLRKTDIKKTKVTKNCFFIKTNTNVVILFPRTDEILDLFDVKRKDASK